MRVQIGQNGFSGDGSRSNGDCGTRGGGHIDVDPRSETNETEAVADADRLSFMNETDDASRDEAGDLHNSEIVLPACR